MDEPEQTLTFSDRRATVAVIAGLVGLALFGVVGGALVQDRCDELFTVGERRTFVQGDPAVVFPDDAAAAEALLTYGRGVELGDWRGSVGLGPDADVVATRDGFLVFTAAGVDALEPGLMAVNASRGSDGLRALPAFNGAAIGAAGAAPYEVAVYDEDLALIGCGEVPRDGDVLAIDRVRAFFAQGATLTAVGLDREEDWSQTFRHDVVDAHLLLGAVLVVTEGEVLLVDVGDGATVQRWPLDGGALLALDSTSAVVETPRRTVRLNLRTGGLSDLNVDASRGVALIRDRAIAAAELPALPGGLTPASVVATEGGYVGIEVVRAGERRMLLYGPAFTEAADG